MKNKEVLQEGERLDDLHYKGLMLLQNKKEFCFGIDAVILAGFAKVKEKERVLDLGTGTGVIPLLLSAKTDGESFWGCEVQETMAEMAKRSIAYNDLEGCVKIVHLDLKELTKEHTEGKFHVVTSNPPYMNTGGGLQNPYAGKAIARHEILCTLEDVVATAARMLLPNGRFYMVHRPQRLVDIFETCRKYHLEPKTLRMVHPFVDEEATMVLLECISHRNPLLKVLPPLVVYEAQNQYTKELNEIHYGNKEV
ncbi:MAG: tRNA1(Val) (adenine(37)-N6)-methyltransferase [Bacillota bacterium]